ncbi:MAG: Nif3-like dinuclear metal center hexameric protein [Candidatus Portiera sp.]|nr:Nif3-like dinuclear metal center hexameric protein [Portiera sp.]
MPTNVQELTSFCDELLKTSSVKDYCPNGLQVQGREEVSVIVSGVTACQELIIRAQEENADLLLVHHGYFWKGEDSRVVGMKYARLKLLMDAGINLLAYHLPLDIHRELGNNAHLGSILDIDTSKAEVATLLPQENLGFIAELKKPLSGEQLKQLFHDKLGREPLHIIGRGGNDKPITKVAWCSGAAQDFIEQAKEQGADCYISGEVSERTFHFAKENAIDYYAIGHHHSEMGGVQLLGERIAKEFGISHKFINVPNPV